MRLPFFNIRFGTERYPDRVARRLRTFNIVTWVAAATHGFYAVMVVFDLTRFWWLALANTVAMLLYAAAPLLHRVGPLAALGISSGPVVAGVVGTRKFFYDVWGDAVNVAARMETTGSTGQIQVSQDAYERLRDDFVLEARGEIDVKGKGRMPTWFLLAPRADQPLC